MMIKILRIFELTLLALAVSAMPASALFINGGFETGDFSGWSIISGTAKNQPIRWEDDVDHGLYAVIDDISTMPCQTIAIDPYEGQYMARLNDVFGARHATKISQTDVIRQSDIEDGAKLTVQWGAVLVEPGNPHPETFYPFFGISLSINGLIQAEFEADARDHNSDPSWIYAGSISPKLTTDVEPKFASSGTLYYKHGVWAFDLSGLALGDAVTLEMYAADCGWGGHGGYAFLDGIEVLDKNGIVTPEPSPAVLFLLGIIGLVFIRKKWPTINHSRR